MNISKGRFVIYSVVVLAFLVLLSFQSFQEVNAAFDNVTVVVNITEFSEITVTPTNVSWFTLIPGSNGVTKFLTITNTGSANLTDTYVYTES
ncbi:MAG: hypothetical protein ABIJ92_03230, partial [Candidatus Aenigmatarchaeota archaeon]